MRVPGEPPPDGAYVIREGKRRATAEVIEDAEDDAAERRAENSWDGNYRLSVSAAVALPGESLDGLVERIFAGVRKVKYYRVAMDGALESAGIPLEASEPDLYHYDANLGTTVDTSIVDRFDDCFGDERKSELWTRRS